MHIVDIRDDITRAHFNSKVDVEFDATVSEETRAAMPFDQIARLAGAMDGSRILVAESDEAISLNVKHEMLDEMIREIRRNDEDGLVLMINESFMLKEEYQKRGIGVRSFAIEAKEASDHGFSKIIAEAVGSRRSANFNGFYTWPRLGYDAPLTDAEQAALPEALADAKTILDLTETDEGRAWWWDKGSGRIMEFDLRPESRSWVILNRYMKEHGIQL